MREGWTYKKLGEVATIIGGSTPKSNIEEYWGGSHYWVTPADLKGNKYQGATPRTITNLAIQKTNLQLLPIGTVLLSSRAPIGKVAITTVPMYCNQGFKNVVCSEQLLNEFVYWYLLNKTDYLNSLGRGATFKEISKKATEQISIPVPPLSEQQRIVSELDLLSSIIEKKKAQLKEYDQLAQSIFYDMFGDPVTNEKGWEIGDIQSVYRVTSSKRILQTEWLNKGVPFYKVADIVSLINGNNVNPTTFIKKSTYDDLHKANLIPNKGDILVTSRGTLGKCYIIKENDNFYFQDGMITWLSQKEKEVSPIYIRAVFSSNSFSQSLLRSANSSTVAYISINQLSKKNIPLPPLNLQQSFASKIEAIERQKALIQQSINEVETLFNSRMDYYFN